MLTVHHLRKSQSERIVWLCEELGLDYVLKCYQRDSVTMLAPPEYKALHPMGAAPVITDGDVTLAESGAVIEYIIARYGHGRLALAPDHPDFHRYLYWFHFANGSLQPGMGRGMVLRRLDPGAEHPISLSAQTRLARAFDLIETHLGEASYFAGSNFTAADIIMVFSLTTMRFFLPFDLSPYPNILAYLQRIGGRDAYRNAMRKGDPEMTLLLT